MNTESEKNEQEDLKKQIVELKRQTEMSQVKM